MFLVNSRLGLVSATLPATPRKGGSRLGSPLSRSYGGILPSSFTTIISIALVFSTYPPVSVWGTGGSQLAHEAFLGSIGSPTPPQTWQCHHVSAFTPHGFANVTAYALSPRQPSRGMGYLPASLRSLPTTGSGHRLNHPTPRRAYEWSRVLSITGLDTDVASPVPEYQLVVHRLRLSASP